MQLKFVAALAFALLLSAGAHAQEARVVASCGTLPAAYAAGSTQYPTVDANGKLCLNSTVPTAVWTAYSPVVTCATGAVGTYSRQNGSYEQIGKLTIFQADVQAAIGTCTGAISVSLPAAAVTTQQQVVTAADVTTFIPQEGFISTSSASVVGLATATGGNPTGSDNFVCGGTYQTP